MIEGTIHSFCVACAGLLGLALSGNANADPVDDAEAAFRSYHFEEARTLLEPLAQSGNAEAQLRLGQIYVNGWGVGQDYVTSAKLFTAAAGAGNAEAQYELGKQWVEGRGVSQNDAEMVKWHTRSAKQGFHKALNAMGEMYAYGFGVKVNYVEAYKWYSLAIKAGDKNQLPALEYLIARMTPEQISDAKELASEWKAVAEPPR
jgi:TPR repeat protein